MVASVTVREAHDDPRLVDLKRRVQRELEALRASFLVRRPFLAQLALQLDLIAVVDDRIGTAATNGRVIYFDARFFEASSPAHREFVFAHEVWHCALGHMSRARGRDHQVWNLATDHEINVLLHEDGFEVPRDAVSFPPLAGLSAEEVYPRLLASPERRRLERTTDVHLPSARLEPHNAMLLGNSPGHNGATITLDRDVRIDEAPPAPAEAAALVVSATRRVGRMHGSLPGSLAARINAFTKPKVDWRVVFAQFLDRLTEKSYFWSRPQRRMVHCGLNLPARKARHGVRQVVVAIDVSGSVIDLAAKFVSEVRGMLNQVEIVHLELLFFDTRICLRTRITSATPLKPLLAKVKAGGGTDFQPVFKATSSDAEAPALIVVLTDGFGPAPSLAPDAPVLWVLPDFGKVPARWGLEVRI